MACSHLVLTSASHANKQPNEACLVVHSVDSTLTLQSTACWNSAAYTVSYSASEHLSGSQTMGHMEQLGCSGVGTGHAY